MDVVAFSIAILGFTFGMFGLIAFAQVNELKKEVQQLKDQSENDGR